MPKAIDEAELFRLIEAQRIDAAVELLLREHGGGFFGYILSILGDEALAADAYQVFSLRLWQSLPSFQRRSQVRTWCLSIARNAALRTASEPFRRRGQRLVTQDEEALVERWQRTGTAQWQKTEQKQKLWKLVEKLEPADRELLALRLGQQLPWTQIAELLSQQPLSAEELKRSAAAARKRFERLKGQLETRLLSPEPS